MESDTPSARGRGCFVVTGGPGAGKSTLLAALARRGHGSVPESGRAVIRDQVAVGGRGLPWSDPPLYAELMLARDLAQFRRFAGRPGLVFFDRGVVDLIGYARLAGFSPPDHFLRAARACRYAGTVFLTPPWRAIYVNDAERRQSFEEAAATFAALAEAYREQGYRLVEIPPGPIEARADFVLARTGVTAGVRTDVTGGVTAGEE